MARPARTGLRAVGLVDHRDDVLPELFLEERKRQLGVLRIAAVHDLVVRHRDDHRQRLAFRNQVVGDETGAAVDVPVDASSPLPPSKYSTGYFRFRS